MSEMYPLRDWDNNIIGYTGYKAHNDIGLTYTGYTGPLTDPLGYTYSMPARSIFGNLTKGETILIYNDKKNKPEVFFVTGTAFYSILVKKKKLFSKKVCLSHSDYILLGDVFYKKENNGK